MKNVDPVNLAFGRAVAKRREELRMTQAKLASLTGLSRASIASIEKGRQNVLLSHIYALSPALKYRHAGDLLPSPPSLRSSEVEVRASDGQVSDSDARRVRALIDRIVPARPEIAGE